LLVSVIFLFIGQNALSFEIIGHDKKYGSSLRLACNRRDSCFALLPAPSLIAAREALFRIPESRLYLTQPDNPNVLVSATPLLGAANFQDSASYLDEFGLNTLKRLCDGFYEQQLVISSGAENISSWLAGSSRQLPISMNTTYTTGCIVMNGSTVANDTNGVFILLRRDSVAPKGYVIHTAYPQ